MRRKNVIVAFFDTIQNDVVREIDNRGRINLTLRGVPQADEHAGA